MNIQWRHTKLGNETAIYFTSIPIVNNQPQLFLSGANIYDNNNNIPESGELLRLGINLTNVGQPTATNVRASINTSDEYVTILQKTSGYADIVQNGIEANQQDYILRISPNCPNNHTIDYSVQVTANSLSWTRYASIIVKRPTFSFDNITFANTGDNIISPGETVTAIISIINNSDVSSNQGILHIIENNDYISLADTVKAITSIPAGKCLQVPINVTVSSSAPVNSLVGMNLRFDVGSTQEAYKSTSFVIGSNIFTYNFESSTDGFTANPTDGWQWGTPTTYTAYQGQKCWAVRLSGSYANNINWKLDSPAIIIGANATLKFYHYYQTENSYDGGNVKISTDNGTTFSVINPVGSYPDNAITALSNEPGYTNNSNGWVLANFDLSAYAGQSIILRWNFASDGSQIGNGWFLDNIVITNAIPNIYDISGTVSLNGGIANKTNIVVSTLNNVVHPNEAGVYHIFLPQGTYTLKSTLENYEPATSTQTVSANQANVNMSLNFLPAPQNLVGQKNSNNSITLTWQYSSSMPSNLLNANSRMSTNTPLRATLLNYKIYRQINNGSYALIDSTTSTTYTDNNTQLNKIHRYYIVATYNNPRINSIGSNVVGLIPGSGPSWVPVSYTNVTTAHCQILFNNGVASEK